MIEEVVAPHRLVAVPIEVKTGPVQDGAASSPEPVTLRNPGVLYGLGNLVENAIDFANNKVDVEARWSKDEVTIVIADDGAGFPPHVLEQLGEPFVTTRRAQRERQRGFRRACRHGARLFHRQDAARAVGARLELANRLLPQGGAVVTVVWPRAKFVHPVATPAPRPEPVG